MEGTQRLWVEVACGLAAWYSGCQLPGGFGIPTRRRDWTPVVQRWKWMYILPIHSRREWRSVEHLGRGLPRGYVSARLTEIGREGEQLDRPVGGLRGGLPPCSATCSPSQRRCRERA